MPSKNATTTTAKNATATTKGGSAAPSNSTTKGPTGNSGTQRTTQAPADTCPSGHTKAGKWCIPWWVWLLLGLLLLMLLLCLLAWLLHFCCKMCMGSHRPEKEIVERDREWSGVDAEQQTDAIFDQRSPRSATPAITVSPAPSTPTTKEIHHHHHHKTEVINNNNTVTTSPAPPSSNVIYDVTVYENTFNFRKDAIPPLPIQSVPNSLMLLPPPEEQDSINSGLFLHEILVHPAL
ncbi:hypothetical protein AAVH_05638 [Aphelenchoides avenae]|nr:hypothetical protein AAVH_05638 [Aphelenchus avenae]